MKNDNKLLSIEIFDKIIAVTFIAILFAGLIFFAFLKYLEVNKPVYPMQNMRCLVKADARTTIEQECTVLGEVK